MREGCELCKYYVQHYRIENGFIISVGCGHCSNPNTGKNIKNTKYICEHYEISNKSSIDKLKIDLINEIKLLDKNLNNFLTWLDKEKDAD